MPYLILAYTTGTGAPVVGWDLSTLSYNSTTFAISEESLAQDIVFSDDGTKMYVGGNQNKTVYQYTLSTAWDLGSASYASKSLATGTQVTGALIGNAFGDSGTKLYALDGTNKNVYQYTVGTPWDVSTASYASKSVSVSAATGIVHDITFSSDGTKMFIIDTDEKVYQYTLSVAWDISTATYDSVFYSVAGQATSSLDVAFSPDGTRMYVISNDAKVYQYSLSTAWSVASGVSYVQTVNLSGDLGGQVSASALAFKTDGSKLYGLKNSPSVAYEYDF